MHANTLTKEQRETNERCAAMNAQTLCTNQGQITHPLDSWMQACGLVTDNAAAHALRVHRNTIPNMRARELTYIEQLAMAAYYHRIPPFTRT